MVILLIQRQYSPYSRVSFSCDPMCSYFLGGWSVDFRVLWTFGNYLSKCCIYELIFSLRVQAFVRLSNGSVTQYITFWDHLNYRHNHLISDQSWNPTTISYLCFSSLSSPFNQLQKWLYFSPFLSANTFEGCSHCHKWVWLLTKIILNYKYSKTS